MNHNDGKIGKDYLSNAASEAGVQLYKMVGGKKHCNRHQDQS